MPSLGIIQGGLYFRAFLSAGTSGFFLFCDPFPSDRSRGSGCIRSTLQRLAGFSAGGTDWIGDACG